MTDERVYLVKGDDPALVAQATRRLVERLVGEEDRSMVVEDYGGEEIDLSSVANACSTAPLFAPRRVVVVRDVGGLRADQLRLLVDCVESLVDSTALVLVVEGGAVPPSLSKVVKRVGEVLDAGAGTGRARSDWLSARLREAPVRLDSGASRQLAAHLGEDLGRLDPLLEALAAAYGEGARLGAEDLDGFLGEEGALPPWELTDAIDRGDTATALEVVARMQRAGHRHPLGVLAILHRHYSAMLRLDGSGVGSDSEAAEVLGSRSAFTAGKALAQGRRLGSEGVARAIELLAAADLDLRGLTGWPPETVIDVLVARLSRLGHQSGRARRAGSRR